MIQTTGIIKGGAIPGVIYSNKLVYRELEANKLLWEKIEGKIEIKAQIRYYQLVDDNLGDVTGNENYLTNAPEGNILNPWPYGNNDFARKAERGQLVDPATTLRCTDNPTENAVDEWDFWSGQQFFTYVFRAMDGQMLQAFDRGII